MDINEKYKDLWQIKENTYKKLELELPVVIFMDGKSVTNNHKGFRMLNKGNYTEMLIKCAKELVKEINADAILYAGLDEISIIFKKPKDIIRYFGVGDNANYICSIFVQKFEKKFWNYYDCYFKNTIYSLQNKDIERYLKYRKEICYNGGLWYIAKEFLEKGLYKGLDSAQMESLLKNKNLSKYKKIYPYIFKGYQDEIKKNEIDILDIIDVNNL